MYKMFLGGNMISNHMCRDETKEKRFSNILSCSRRQLKLCFLLLFTKFKTNERPIEDVGNPIWPWPDIYKLDLLLRFILNAFYRITHNILKVIETNRFAFIRS